MKYTFPYDFAGQIEIPDRNLIGVFQAHPHSDLPEEEIIVSAIQNPIGAQRLRYMVKADDHVLLLIDDATRMTPAARIIPLILDELAVCGIPDQNIRILTSIGTHRKMTEPELVKKLGLEIRQRFKVCHHHWEELDQLYLVANSSSGIPIHVNREALWADHIIGIGCIFPHAVAGYSGGGKIVIPGITGEATCGDMHWAMYGIPPVDLYGVVENPVRQIIDEFAEKAGLNYIVDAVLDENGRVVDMVAGHPIIAHRAGAALSKQQYGVDIPRKADIVIFDCYGSDLEYWQAIKGITPAGIVMKDGGIVIQVALCTEGISVSHPEVLEYGYRPLGVVEEMVAHGLVNKSVAAHMIQASEVIVDRGRGFLISPNINAKDTVRLGFMYAESVQEALNRALQIKGPNASIMVLSHSGDLLPVFPGHD